MFPGGRMGVLNPSDFVNSTDVDEEIVRLRRRLARERTARTTAEGIAERGLRALYLSQQRIELLHRIAAKANAAADTREALSYAIAEICTHTGWAFGHVYLADETNRDLLVAPQIWFSANPEPLMPFITESLELQFARGVGLPGRVLDTLMPIWLVDLGNADNFLRRDVARQCGLHSAFAFPVCVQDEVVAVMEFFARENLAEDAQFLELMAQIGVQLGRVIERERFTAKLYFDALHDSLTGLPNRALFAERVAIALERRERRPEYGVAVLFLDLDGFKFINDSLGHQVGDDVLVATGRRLADVLATQAAAQAAAGADWPMITLARLGGDEFTVVIEDFDDEAAVHAVANAMLGALAEPHLVDGNEIHSGGSIGLAFAHKPGATVQGLLRKADTAMYEAKARGRGQVAVFDKVLQQRASTRLQTENDLRGALRREEFQLYYQPIVELKTGTISGFEALLRWQRRPDELVAPGHFIDIAEETGLIVTIGSWVLREACEATARWHRRFAHRKPVTMSINVSPRQFLQPGFVEFVETTIRETGIDPATISLEITEGIAIANPDRAVHIMTELRALGVKMSLDDFGTGYSSLGHLHRYPFNTLKLDRSFVLGLGEGSDRIGTGIVQAVLDLASTMNLSVIAEGLETNRQRRHLRGMGCEFGQGYFYSKPVSAESAELLLVNAR
ncbi:bifunctional diguanylate cyclase/phosphodiesterase [Sphingomonas sp. 32-62-10]|nr:MAG: hypothetical protein B7Z43_05545 [Sphingomonas sp. 12-62-6]OYX37558.1 MAG: hypothetical protein B7Y98_12040 [Sphingomonas sp. 32-62-10]